ncbi:MAG: recombinase family protein [Anaerolineales bacterium]|nr:recombinase family protein [Anaerolineales bacterium]
MDKKIKNAPGSRAVLYARVSTEEQAGKDHYSIEAQLHEMRDYASEKGWSIVGEFVDEGESGTKRDRPQLNAALSVTQKKGCDIFLAHELSRLSRSVYHTLDIFDKLGQLQVGFASVKDPEFDFSDPSKRFFLTIMAAINEYYIHLLRQHTSKSKRERSRQGLYNASISPLGYALSGDAKKPAVINEEEAPIIRLIFESYASGRYSDQDVADLLNQKEYHTRAGRRFTKDGVSEILTSVYYVGKVSYTEARNKREIYDGQHQALISEDLWEKCQNVRSSRRHLSRAVQKKYRNYLLSTLAVCDVCGRTLRAQGANTGSYYREMSYERGYIDCPHQKTGVRAELLEKQVHELIKYIQLPEDWTKDVVDQAGDENEMINLHRQRDRIEAERRRLQQMRIEGDFDDNMDVYREEMDRIRRESAALPTNDQIESLKVTAQTIGDLYQIWESAEPGDQRDLLRLMLREVRVDVPNGRITSIAPLAVFVPIFRKLPMLFEYDFGYFLPLWNEVTLPSVEQLPAAEEPLANYPTLPFFDVNPLVPQIEIRNTPAIAEALKLSGKKENTKVVQIVRDDATAFPMDFRKWHGAHGYSMTLDEFIEQPEGSFDVVISQFVLWESERQENLDVILSKIIPGGVWYFNELLPVDFPGHWLYHAMPATWAWVKKNTLSLHAFYNRLQMECNEIKIKRHVYSQSISHEAADDVLRRNPKVVQAVSEEALAPAIARLGELGPLTAEFTIIEGWAKKRQV